MSTQVHVLIEVRAMGEDAASVCEEIARALGRVNAVMDHEMASAEVHGQHDVDELIRGCYGHYFAPTTED